MNNKNNKVNTGVGNNTVNNKPNKVNIGVGNNTINKPNKVNTGVGNNTVNNKPNKPVNNKSNKPVNIGVGNNTVNNKNNNGNTIMTNTNANNKSNNGNTIMTNANNTEPNSNVKPNNQARRNEENRKKAEKEAQEAKRREEIEAKREAAREEIRKRQEELKKKREESKRIANIEKNLLSIPNVDKVYLTAFKGNKSIENVNKNALANKVKRDLVIRNLRNQLSPLFMGKRRVAYVNPSNYNSTKTNIEGQISNKEAKKADLEALKKLSVNAVVSTDYVKAFANGKSFVNVSLNTLKNKRNKDLEVYKLNATNKKGVFGGYSTTVPGTKTMKFIPNAEYNKTLNRAKTALEARRNAKQLAENKRKPKPNNNANNAKPNNNANNAKPNGNVKPNNNTEFMGPNNKLNTIEEEPNNFKNASNKFENNKKNNNNFNASAELNKQLNNEAKRQNRAKNKNNNNNFNAAAELNKQLNNEGKRINRAAKNKNNNNNFNASAELNKQLNNEGKRQQNVMNKNLENRRKKLTNKTEREVAKFMGRIGKWRPAIINAKTITELNNLNKNLNNRIKLRNNIKKSVLTRKEQSEYANMVMKLNKKVANTRKLFENGVNKKISNTTGPLVKGILNKAVANNKRGSFNGGLRLGNNNNNIINGKPKPVYNNSNSNNNVNNKKKMRLGGRAAEQNMKPNPIFEPNMKNNPTFEVFENKKPNNKPKITNENLRPMKSAIGGLKQLPKNKKSGFESRLNAAFKNQNLNKMKAIRNEAIAANKVIQNQLAEEKRLKEEAKEAKRKEEAEKAAAKKAEREAKEKKKANALKAVENAANAYVAARKPKPSFKALVQKNKERRVMNAVKTAAQKTAISEATGAERIQLAKKFAPRTQANIKKANNASKVFKSNVRKAAEGAAESAKEKLRRNAVKRATMMNKSSYQAKINSRNFKIPKNRKKIFTSRIQRATTLGQVLKAYENAQSELPK